MLQLQSREVILFYPSSQVYHKNKGKLEVKPVIAVTGSGQKNTTAPSDAGSQHFDGPN